MTSPRSPSTIGLVTSPARVAIVTGAAQGLGASVCRRLADEGWAVVGADVRAETTSAGCIDQATCDVSDEREVAALIDGVIDRHGRLDAVVNNAGIGGTSDLVAELSLEDFQRVLAVNLVGTFLVSRAAIPHLIATAPGSAIVNFGSLFGQQGVDHGAAYCASKGGVTLLTHSLARELAPYGIRVNTVAPGNMLTEMHRDELRYRAKEEGVSPEEMEAAVRRAIPLGRHGTGEDIAGAVAWLLSEDASYVTGQTISVNGGVLLT